MLKLKLFGLYVAFRSLLCGCGSEPAGFEKNRGEYEVKSIANLPPRLAENSGLAVADSAHLLWTHQDSGGANKLFKINLSGEILDTLAPENVDNVDWEDLAKDSQGNIYIGDFGNNLNNRKNLRIYKYHPATQKVDTISFHFSDQAAFPPDKKNMNFDCEAFFWLNGELHLFSKNRGQKCVKHYVLPDQAGTYEALAVQEIYLKRRVTSADVSPHNKAFALLAYGRIYMFEISEKNGLLGRPYKCIKFGKGGQSEALMFINDEDFVISNEAGKLFLGKKCF